DEDDETHLASRGGQYTEVHRGSGGSSSEPEADGSRESLTNRIAGALARQPSVTGGADDSLIRLVVRVDDRASALRTRGCPNGRHGVDDVERRNVAWGPGGGRGRHGYAEGGRRTADGGRREPGTGNRELEVRD